MKRFTRLAALAVGVLAMVGATAPPASATTIIETTFVGSATVTGGLGYPVVTLPTPTTPRVDCLDPLPDGNPVPNCHTHYVDHEHNVVVASDIECRDESTNIDKPGKAPQHTGGCVFNGSGHVSGHCGLSGGQVTGTYRDSLGQLYDFSVHFTGVGGELVVTGHVTKQATGRHGKITGEVTAAPDVLGTTGQSCTTKNQQRFIIAGETRIVIQTEV